MQKITLGPRIIIDWDPVSDDGQVRVDLVNYIEDDLGNVTSFTDPSSVDPTYNSIADIATKVAATAAQLDAVTGENLPNQMSGAGIMFAIKRLVDVIIAERREEKAQEKLMLELAQPSADTVSLDLSSSTFLETDSFVDMTIDWGDGSPVSTVATMTDSHTYAAVAEPTEYTINVTVNTTEFTGLSLVRVITVGEPAV